MLYLCFVVRLKHKQLENETSKVIINLRKYLYLLLSVHAKATVIFGKRETSLL